MRKKPSQVLSTNKIQGKKGDKSFLPQALRIIAWISQDCRLIARPLQALPREVFSFSMRNEIIKGQKLVWHFTWSEFHHEILCVCLKLKICSRGQKSRHSSLWIPISKEFFSSRSPSLPFTLRNNFRNLSSQGLKTLKNLSGSSKKGILMTTEERREHFVCDDDLLNKHDLSFDFRSCAAYELR